MKNIFRSIFLLAAAVTAAACATDPAGSESDPAQINTAVAFGAEQVSDASRATIDPGESTFTMQWTDGDALGIASVAPGATTGTLGRFTYDPAQNKFTGIIPSAETGDWKYTAYYPHIEGTSSGHTMAYLPFGSARTQKGNAYNSNFDALVAEPISTTGAGPGVDANGKPVSFKLHRITSILYLELSSSEYADEKVRSITLEADKTLSAKEILFKHKLDAFDLGQINAKFTTASDAAPQNRITLTFEKGTAPTVADCKAYFNILPDTYTEFTVTVRTDRHKSTFSFTPSRAYVAGKMYRKQQALTAWDEFSAPTIEWEGNPEFARQEITSSMDVNVEFVSDYGFKEFTVDIVSPTLTDELFAMMGDFMPLATHLDLINPASDKQASALQSLGFPVRDQVQNQNMASFKIGELVPMIMAITTIPDSNHDFNVTVTDNMGNTVTKTLGFHCTVEGTYSATTKMWDRKATLTTASSTASTITAEYRVKGATAWSALPVTKNGTIYTAEIAPVWKEDQNEAGITRFSMTPDTGIKPATAYEYRFVVDGTAKDTQEFTTPAGDVIQGGDMEDAALPCFNAPERGQTGASTSSITWGSGNNFVLSQCVLCSQASYATGGGYATLNSTTSGGVLAAGNLFFGQFVQAGTGGEVRFGQTYEWSTRPRALSLSYTHNIGTVDKVPTKKDLVKIQSGQPDQALIFVAIVDWTGRHSVVSKALLPWSVTGAWNPADGPKAVNEGKIIGYGLLEMTGQKDWSSTEIPIYYYDKDAMPTPGNISLVISCACSRYGDFFNGCSSNSMGVDDFEWVY